VFHLAHSLSRSRAAALREAGQWGIRAVRSARLAYSQGVVGQAREVLRADKGANRTPVSETNLEKSRVVASHLLQQWEKPFELF